MTLDELQNNYEYKLTTRVIKKDFPFILDLLPPPSDEELNRYPSIIFLKAIINPYILSSLYGFSVWSLVTKRLQRGETFPATYLSMFLKGGDNASNSYEEVKPVVDDIETTIYNIHSSRAIPSDLKLPNNITLDIGSWIAYPNTLPDNLK